MQIKIYINLSFFFKKNGLTQQQHILAKFAGAAVARPTEVTEKWRRKVMAG